MKKTVIIAISFLVSMLLTGCSQEDATPQTLTNALNEARAEVAFLEGSIDDPEFWDSVKTSAHLVRETLEKGHEYELGVMVEIPGGKLITIPMMLQTAFFNETWVDLYEQRIILVVASNRKVSEAHEQGETAKVVSTTLQWVEFAPDGYKQLFELYDLDNNGEWDEKEEGA